MNTILTVRLQTSMTSSDNKEGAGCAVGSRLQAGNLTVWFQLGMTSRLVTRRGQGVQWLYHHSRLRYYLCGSNRLHINQLPNC